MGNASKMNSTHLHNISKIPNTICDSLVVAAARVSFQQDAKQFDPERDAKLINYLVSHDHWSPLAHPHGAFIMSTPLDEKLLKSLIEEPIAGLRWGSSPTHDYKAVDYVSGSLWGLLRLGNRLGSTSLIDLLGTLAPLSVKASLGTHRVIYPTHGVKRNWVQVIPREEDKVTTLRIEAPLAIARQLWKHQQGLEFSEQLPWNEASGRYIDMSKNGYFIPPSFHAQAENKKQGVEPEMLVQEHPMNDLTFEEIVKLVDEWYKNNSHIGNEERRLLLPACTMTSWYWTARERDWNRVLKLRLDPHAQLLTQDVAKEIERILESEYE
jgi:thymidylate synthase ThyX